MFCLNFFQEVSLEFKRCCHVLLGKFYGCFLNVLGKFVLRWERGRTILWQRCNLAQLSNSIQNLGFAQVTLTGARCVWTLIERNIGSSAFPPSFFFPQIAPSHRGVRIPSPRWHLYRALQKSDSIYSFTRREEGIPPSHRWVRTPSNRVAPHKILTVARWVSTLMNRSIGIRVVILLCYG